MIEFSREQHAIGQGCFHTAALGSGTVFRYAYDCGSRNKALLLKSIQRYVESIGDRPLDLLVLSHFHSDHVSGLDDLFSLAKVDTVVIPYVRPIERLAIAAKLMENEDAGFDSLDRLFAPGRWLRRRGVSRLIIVGPGDNPPDFGGPPTAPSNNSERDDPRMSLAFEKMRSLYELAPEGEEQPSPLTVYYHSHAMPLMIRSEGRIVEWELLAYVHPEDERLQAFQDKVSIILGDHANGIPDDALDIRFDSIRRIVTESACRRKLVDAYRSVFGNLNGTSLSLYSGPSLSNNGFYCESRAHCTSPHLFGPLYKDSLRVGWLGTGDADLRTEERRMAFMTHFGLRLDLVSTCMLPHHGSQKNFHVDLLRRGIPLFFATARAGNRHHPGKSVIADIATYGSNVVQISDSPRSTLYERGYMKERGP